MRRTIVQPADLSGAALAELKHWLGISRPNEDELLVGLLEASTTMCESFIGQVPVELIVEEFLPPKAGRTCLISRPVRLLTSAELVAANGERSSLSGHGHGFEVDDQGVAIADIKSDLEGRAIAVQLMVGIAQDWSALPGPLRQGILRLAAFYYRDRDQQVGENPPASVTALWRPWRTLRLT